ncbi:MULTISPECIES: hypothetical protein [Virgibacillus]|nr:MULTISPECIES: hypothetical protein [Virgibacillus]MEB5450733.1 hypothetical protein [Virgibacillus pantothenticus]MEB5454753.1 hypothetical protein [Virgibacillus pantothenticus]MEB5458676.1 hypothetical protein [Virgibacillus pantothenticus]MEB5464247.1 hypothetical protein [Virgibacillus pantothenticus]MEB5468572.1 hypothetical protein [Virgibacillus pantothenticus]
MTQSVLQVNHLNKSYGKYKETQSYALKDVSFEMKTGEFVCY